MFGVFNNTGSSMRKHYLKQTNVTCTHFFKCEGITSSKIKNEISNLYDTPVVGTVIAQTTGQKIGTACLFIGNSTSYINLANILGSQMAPGRLWSLAMWFKMPISNTANNVMLAFFSDTLTKNSIRLRVINNSMLEIIVVANNVITGNAGIILNTSLKDDNWHHIVWIVGSYASILYLDNVLLANFSASVGLLTNIDGSGSRIGAILSLAVDPINQYYVDDIQFYQGSLLPYQIDAIYNGYAII